MFNALAFSIVGDKKPKTKNSKISNENTNLDWVPWKKTLKKTSDFLFCKGWVSLKEP
jgi:hypothetical protein